MYKVVELPYDYSALEPNIDEKTVYIHYEFHHKGYLKKLNNILEGINYKYDMPLEELVVHIDEFPMELRGDILFNAGGVLNHNLYWIQFSENGKREPIGKIKEAIDKKYGNYEKFKKEFKERASKVVGSGWTFLVINPNNELEIINTSNQETPYLYGLKPIIALDLWEHSYYLLYQNNRADYVNNFFNILDYEKINEIYEKSNSQEN